MTHELLNHKAKCRLCFQRISGTRNISRITGSVQQKFFSLTNIELKSSDKFSCSICKPCIKSLNESSEFQHKLINNQRRLYAFEGDSENASIKLEPVHPQSEEFLDVTIKTEVFDFEVVQMNEDVPIDPGHDLSDMDSGQMPDSPGNDENPEVGNDSLLAPDSVKKKKERNYSLEQVNDALEAFRKGQLTVGGAARRFGIPLSTLRRKVSTKHFVTHGKGIFLTEEEEVQVRTFVKNRIESGIPSTNEDLVNCAIRILKKRERNYSLAVSTLSTRWVESFRDRHAFFSEVQSDEGFTHTCDLCNFSVLKKKDIRIHMTYHTTEKIGKPLQLERKKYSKSDLESAVKFASTESVSINAAARLFGVPTSTLRKQLFLNKEQAEEDGDKPKNDIHKCSYCDKVFYSFWNMRSHTKRHLVPVGEFKCEECGKIFLTVTRLEQHKLIHKPGVFRCKRCNLVFDMVLDAQKHYATHRPLIPCEICGKMVRKGSRYSTHMKTHGPPSQKCPFEGCSKAYTGKASLDYHIENLHTPKQKIKCPKCDSTFPNAQKLKRHDERSHGEAKFFCAVDGCSYKSTRMDYLKLHLRNHRDIDVKLKGELINNLRVKKTGN